MFGAIMTRANYDMCMAWNVMMVLAFAMYVKKHYDNSL